MKWIRYLREITLPVPEYIISLFVIAVALLFFNFRKPMEKAHNMFFAISDPLSALNPNILAR